MELSVESKIKKINWLGDRVYDCFLKEVGDYSNPEEWYEVALTVADRFKGLILQSRDKHMIRIGRRR
jgi:hypothetical protein